MDLFWIMCKFSHSVVSNFLWPHGLQYARLPCPSPTPGACSGSCPLNQWCHPIISFSVILLLLPSIFPSIRAFSNESALRIRWPKYWSFNISPSNEYSGLIFFRIAWFDLPEVQGTLKNLLQHHSSKATILWHSAFFIVQLSHPYMTTGKTIALTRWNFVGIGLHMCKFSSVQLLSRVRLFATPWITARQASLSITNSPSLLKLMSIESVMPSSHLSLCRPLLFLPPVPPSIKVFSNESTLCMRWPKYLSFSFSISPSNEYPGLICFRMDWLDLLAVQGTLKSLLQHHSSKAWILRRSAFLTVQLLHPYMTTGKTISCVKVSIKIKYKNTHCQKFYPVWHILVKNECIHIYPKYRWNIINSM